MLKIRLQRVGRRNHAEYRVVVTEHTRGPKSAKYLEMVGSYNPHRNESTLNRDRIHYWLAHGAQPTDTLHNLLVSEQVIDAPKINVLPRKSPIAKEEGNAEESGQQAAEPHEEASDAPDEAEAEANERSAEAPAAGSEASDKKEHEAAADGEGSAETSQEEAREQTPAA